MPGRGRTVRRAPWCGVGRSLVRVAALLVVLMLAHDVAMSLPAVARHDIDATDQHAYHDPNHQRGNGTAPDEAVGCGVTREARLSVPASLPPADAGPAAPFMASGDAVAGQNCGRAAIADRSPPTRPPRLMLAMLQVLRV